MMSATGKDYVEDVDLKCQLSMDRGYTSTAVQRKVLAAGGQVLGTCKRGR